MSPWIAGIVVVLLPVAAFGQGSSCGASGAWSPCADGACLDREVATVAVHQDASRARALATTRCRASLSAERMEYAWRTAAHLPPAHDPLDGALLAVGQVTRPCRVDRCTPAPGYVVHPNADAFDDPICEHTRVFICGFCASESPLCQKVQRERPVTATACSDTYAELDTFLSLLDQLDTIEMGARDEAVGELCGAPPPSAHALRAPTH